MPTPRRREKINQLVREELGNILNRDIDIPTDMLLTITRVDTSTDGYYATVFVNCFSGDILESGVSKEDARRTADTELLDLLEKNVYNIQQRLNRQLRMRPIPKITFAIDVGEEKRDDIERTIIHLKREDPDNDA